MNNESAAQTEPTKSSDKTIFSLLHAAHALEDRVEATLARVGLSMAKFGLLSELVSSGRPLSLGDLAARLSCVKSNMTQLADRLEAEGFVKRTDDPKDRRAVLAAITELGRERHAAAAEAIAKLHEEFAAKVAGPDKAAMERVLNALE